MSLNLSNTTILVAEDTPVMAQMIEAPVDGLEMIRKVRRDPRSPRPRIPVIMMTGYNAVPRVREARDTGVTEYLVKPFSAHDLAKRLAYVINKPRDFVIASSYFGPDRRRRNDGSYTGPDKRA